MCEDKLIILTKFNLPILSPLPWDRSISYYEKSDSELVQRSANEVDWLRAISNVSVEEEVFYFTKIFLSIIYNFISDEIIICDDKTPFWINKAIKKKLIEKNSSLQIALSF